MICDFQGSLNYIKYSIDETKCQAKMGQKWKIPCKIRIFKLFYLLEFNFYRILSHIV